MKLHRKFRNRWNCVEITLLLEHSVAVIDGSHWMSMTQTKCMLDISNDQQVALPAFVVVVRNLLKSIFLQRNLSAKWTRNGASLDRQNTSKFLWKFRFRRFLWETDIVYLIRYKRKSKTIKLYAFLGHKMRDGIWYLFSKGETVVVLRK